MLHILTFDAPTLVAALRGGYFRRCGLRVTIAGSVQEMIERAEVLRPEVIIVVAGAIDSREERGAAQQLRAHLSDRRGTLLLAVPHERRALEEDLQSYDGIVSLEEPDLDLARALSPFMALPKRRQARMRVRVPIVLFAGENAPVHGMTVDLSAAGAGLH